MINDALSEYADALKAGLALEDMRAADLLNVARRRSKPCSACLAHWSRHRRTSGSRWTVSRWSRRSPILPGTCLRTMACAPSACARRRTAVAELDWSGSAPSSAATHSRCGKLADADWHPANAPDTEGRARAPRRRNLDPVAQDLAHCLVQAAAAARRAGRGGTAAQRRTIDSRPEYYDFDLFRNADTAQGLADRKLVDLHYTVFDTETTGLEPSAGDEIISLGAVRIVNGRLLKQEVFEQLVNPQRPVGKAASRIHGIDAQALAGQPTIADVLPQFQHFCEDTVLVAHNAAFDMRFLELKEAATGMRFKQPVLDTLLLSVIVHPGQEGHNLEAVAERLGVSVIGRHTALGDALVTGEIFLRLLPLLAEHGIVTLGQALDASRETYLARLQY